MCYCIVAEAINRLRRWQQENATASLTALEEELRSIQTFAGLQPCYKVVVFLATNLTTMTAAGLLQDVIAHSAVLKSIGKSLIQQRQLIAAVEWYCSCFNEAISRFFPVLLKHLYDEEILEEDTLLEWSTDPARNEYTIASVSDDMLDNIRKLAAPFVVWLQEAEEEGNSDDEEGEEN
jgi:translation initiation factor 5